MSHLRHLLNGSLVDDANLSLSPRDLGYLRGFGVFDYFVTYGGVPFHLEDHIDRLLESCRLIGLQSPGTRESLCESVHSLLNAQLVPPDYGVRIIVSGGVGPDSLTCDLRGPTVLIMTEPRPAPPAEWYERGGGVTTYEHLRFCPEAKSLNYIVGVAQIAAARRQGALEVVYHADGLLLEGATSNIFLVKDGVLRTPKSRILSGVTRKVVLEKLRLTQPIRVEDIPYKDLFSSDEAFLTGSTKEILPITRIDGRPVASGEPGPVTREVMLRFCEYTASAR
jgi:branched-chain amino acid aminotransferase